MRTTASFLFVLLVAAAAAHILYIHPRMPDTVPSHFDLAGDPDGWSSKTSFIAIYAAVIALVGGTIYGFALLLPRLPVSMINMPNRDYWLAPERRAASLAAMRENLLWIGVASLAFLIGTIHLTYRVSVGLQEGLGDAFWALMGAYALAIAWAVAWVVRRFRKPTAAA